MSIVQKLRDCFSAAIPFIMARHKTTGGFGATPRLPATIEDTYYALNILKLAQKFDVASASEVGTFTENNMLSYLDSRRRSSLSGIRTTFQLLWCCRTARLELEPGNIEAAVIARMSTSDSLEDWYFGTRIMTEVLARKPLMIAEESNLAAILDRDWRCVDEAWMHMYISREFRNDFPWPAPELIAWFRACQTGDGGFGFFPGTTSFVENCYVCLRALDLLGKKPLHPNRAFRFLLGCQTASGGFGRSSRAAPFLDSTWYTLAALAIIGCPK
jgi:hypothetical protein